MLFVNLQSESIRIHGGSLIFGVSLHHVQLICRWRKIDHQILESECLRHVRSWRITVSKLSQHIVRRVELQMA
jgi:hypothetical protein